ncbi:MAG: HD domain-containing protein [Desulfobacterales bacterium]|nr:MAG: HD domain-containing protein [Desulfobacterales bacterium]
MKKFEKATSLVKLKAFLNRQETEILSPLAAKNAQGVRRVPDERLDSGYRQAFSVDVDRILHSLAYARYIDKTQVFYLVKNDHITHRVLHVQLVSKIARTIGRFLGLNEDLIEAIALGHDIGHAPFGHDGERFLSEICRKSGIGFFQHNLQSVQFLERVERKGKGWNLCLQTLDGILCHDGELHSERLLPATDQTFAKMEAQIAAKRNDPATELIPMTLEGCLVRMADTVSYIGRDIEDAIRLGLISRSDLPRNSVNVLGDTNGTIVFNLVTDIILNSFQNPYIAFSPEVSEALIQLKAFNLECIYLNPEIKQHTRRIKKLFEILFEKFLDDIQKQRESSVIFRQFLKDMTPEYVEQHKPAEIVRDFISGMTDQFFLDQCPESMRPRVEIA